LDKLVLITLPNGLKKSTYDPNDALSCVCYYTAAAGAALPPAIAQEETSLGEEDLAASIVSNVLGGSDNNDDDDENGSDTAEDEFNQDATVTSTIDPNQEHDVDEDNVGEFGDDNADLDDTM
jgi:hypothetical protein